MMNSLLTIFFSFELYLTIFLRSNFPLSLLALFLVFGGGEAAAKN